MDAESALNLLDNAADPEALLAAFSWWSLLAAFVFGVIGFYLFLNGKRRTNYWWIWIGVALMVYPIFISSAWLNWLVGFGFCALAYVQRDS